MKHNKRATLETLGHHVFGPGPVVDHVSESSFDTAVCRYLGAPLGAKVDTDIQGRQDYQIGDYTWDSDPGYVEVSASWFVEKANGSIKTENRNARFESLAEVWEALV